MCKEIGEVREELVCQREVRRVCWAERREGWVRAWNWGADQ